MTAFYNEHDPYSAQWLRNLIAADLIAPGIVDERGIQDIEPWELHGFTQVHMFAGIGVWSAALRAAGWPDDEPIWTGSCPCQPFSNAGKREGFDDERHLWPVWKNLIAECAPPRVVGEQVASKDGRQWLDLVSADVEALGFAFGAADLCAAGFGQAHIRQRNYFLAVRLADDDARRERRNGMPECPDQRLIGPGSMAFGLGNSQSERLLRGPDNVNSGRGECPSGQGGSAFGLADGKGERRNGGANSSEPAGRGTIGS